MQTEFEARRSTTSALEIALTRGENPLFKRPRVSEELIRAFLFLCGMLSIFTTISIIIVLGRESLLFFQSGLVTLGEFFTSTKWQPQAGEFGILPLLNSTMMTSLAAMVVALPLGLGAAIYLSEYAPARVRTTLKPILEILAGIPTVVYGYFALTFMTPLLRSLFGQDTVQIYNTASAGLVMGIMILPTISSISEDALSAVPRALREASYGLGATKFETIIKVVLPAALSGIIAAFLLGVSRAVGETMIVALAAGAGPNFTLNPFVAAETMTGHIARISGGDLSYNSVDYNSLFAIGLTLFVMTLVLNLISRAVTKRFREVYQ
ncbi:MAG: phosphate ABC transporter permease subunit PstC [Chloroflexota bacterium]